MGSEYIITSTEEAVVATWWDGLEKYLSRMEEYIQKAKGEFEAWANEQVKKLPPEQRSEFYEDQIEEYSYHYEEFPRILRNSFLVSAFSILEYELGMICRRLRSKQNIPVNLNNFRGDILERAKLYFKLAGLHIRYGKEWQELNRYSEIRNCIVHKNGLLKEFQARKGFKTYLKQKRIISKNIAGEEIALTEQFCKEVIKTMHDFTDKVWAKVYESPVRVKAG